MIIENEPEIKTADDLNNALKAWRESNYSDTIDLSEHLGTVRRQEGNETPLYPVMGKDLADVASDMGYDGIQDMNDDFFRGMVYLRFDGNDMKWEKFEDTDDLAEKLGYDAEEMALDSLTEMAENEGLYSDPAYFYQTMLGKGDAEDFYNLEFSEGDTQYSQNFLGGGEEYKEKVYHLRDDFMPLVDIKNARHFDEEQDRIVSHARSAMYEGISGDNIYLMGEAQSDVGQFVRNTRKELIERLERDRQLFVDNTPNVTAADYDETGIRQQFPTFRTFDQMQAFLKYGGKDDKGKAFRS